MNVKDQITPETEHGRKRESILPELERLLRELAPEREPRLGEEIERTIVARIDAYERAVIESIETLCANALVNSRDIERLNRIVASLPGMKTEDTDLSRVLAGIEGRDGDGALSKREKGVLAQLVLGKSNREISVALEISDKTVKNHLWKIYRKLGVGNRSQLFHKLIS